MRELGIEIVLYESVTSELQKRNSASLKWGRGLQRTNGDGGKDLDKTNRTFEYILVSPQRIRDSAELGIKWQLDTISRGNDSRVSPRGSC